MGNKDKNRKDKQSSGQDPAVNNDQLGENPAEGRMIKAQGNKKRK
jgi:hypothetical protein